MFGDYRYFYSAILRGIFNIVDHNAPVPRRTDSSSAALVIPICQATCQHYPVYSSNIFHLVSDQHGVNDQHGNR